jgi:exonuclease 3'-5' domain-containing protein 1
MIDNATALKAFIDGLDKDSILYVDLEGNNLSRHGTLSLITVLVEPRHTVHLVDVTTLGKEAFSVSGTNEKTLQQILESRDIIKVFYDIRNDSDALFSLFGVRVGGIEDLQLMELGGRRGSKTDQGSREGNRPGRPAQRCR